MTDRDSDVRERCAEAGSVLCVPKIQTFEAWQWTGQESATWPTWLGPLSQMLTNGLEPGWWFICQPQFDRPFVVTAEDFDRKYIRALGLPLTSAREVTDAMVDAAEVVLAKRQLTLSPFRDDVREALEAALASAPQPAGVGVGDQADNPNVARPLAPDAAGHAPFLSPAPSPQAVTDAMVDAAQETYEHSPEYGMGDEAMKRCIEAALDQCFQRRAG